MKKRLVCAFVFLLALWSAPVLAANCVSGTPYTAAGTFNCTVPAGVTSITGEVWGAGAAAVSTPNYSAGGGGGFCVLTKTVTPGSPIYFRVPSTTGPAWFNISSSAQPSSAAQGCYVPLPDTSGDPSTGVFGTQNYSGGNGKNLTLSWSGGGGGGAGSNGNGSSGTGSAAGTGGTPDGGQGGSATGGNGFQPGGGGGIYTGSHFGSGGLGQVEFVFAGAASNFIILPATVP